jgi:hypothetical protein
MRAPRVGTWRCLVRQGLQHVSSANFKKLMAKCYSCGSQISFRYIDGLLRPLGCGCYGGYSGFPSQKTYPALRKSPDPQITVPWPVTYPTSCFWCGELVFYHTNGHGDCVLLDDLGPPWPVHACWTAYREDRRKAPLQMNAVIAKAGVVSNLYSEALGSYLKKALPADAWEKTLPLAFERSAKKRKNGDAKEILPYEQPGPFLVDTLVRDGPRLPVGPPHIIVGGEECFSLTTKRGNRLYVPRRFVEHVRQGKPLVVEVITVGVGEVRVHLCVKIGLPNGRHIAVPTGLLSSEYDPSKPATQHE